MLDNFTWSTVQSIDNLPVFFNFRMQEPELNLLEVACAVINSNQTGITGILKHLHGFNQGFRAQHGRNKGILFYDPNLGTQPGVDITVLRDRASHSVSRTCWEKRGDEQTKDTISEAIESICSDVRGISCASRLSISCWLFLASALRSSWISAR